MQTGDPFSMSQREVIAANQTRTSTGSVSIRPIALPVEHGGWGLLFEPIVLGLLLVPSLGGLCLAVAAMACFLARHPFKLAASDRRRSRRLSRTVLAERFVLLYFGIAVLGLVAAIKTAHAGFLLTLLLAAPLSLVQLVYDSMGRSRTLIAELSGSISVGAVAAAIALAGGWPRPAAFGLWAIMAARVVPTILYLRARLRLLHRKSASRSLVIVAHLLAIIH